MNEIIYNTIAD